MPLLRFVRRTRRFRTHVFHSRRQTDGLQPMRAASGPMFFASGGMRTTSGAMFFVSGGMFSSSGPLRLIPEAKPAFATGNRPL